MRKLAWIGMPLLVAACATSGGATESPEFEAEWSQLVSGGASVQRVGGAQVTNNASDGVAGLLSAAMPPSVTGPLTAPEVDRVMRSRLGSIRMCQAQAERRERLPNGKVIVRFQVSTSGAVENVEVEGPSFSRTTLLSCIRSTVRSLQFRASTQPFAAAYPYIFAGG